MNPRAAIGLLVMTLAWSGCQAPSTRLAPEYSDDLIIEGKRIIAAAPFKDKNLWRLRVALAALKEARYNEAKELFDAALPPAGAILQGNAEARQASHRGAVAEIARNRFRSCTARRTSRLVPELLLLECDESCSICLGETVSPRREADTFLCPKLLTHR